ncbi:uncharacterized protein ACR2FA_010481, partial [Aphomia sociella]
MTKKRAQVNSSSLFETSYEYVMGLGKSLAPSFMNIIECMTKEDVWGCARDSLGKVLDGVDEEVQKERRQWQEEADAEVITSGRSIEEMPSKIGKQVEESLFSIAEAIEVGVARAMGRKKHDGGIDSITISTGTAEKKKKKKAKPPKIHLVHPAMLTMHKKNEKGRGFSGKIQSWVIGDELRNVPDEKHDEGTSVDNSSVASVDSSRKGRNFVDNLMKTGDKVLDDVADYAMESDDDENGISYTQNVAENRGKKKKKKKAILKLLLLGAVLKAKIGTILQILSFKLQVKFFILALIGLGINLAKLWIEIKNKHKEQPQKVHPNGVNVPLDIPTYGYQDHDQLGPYQAYNRI